MATRVRLRDPQTGVVKNGYFGFSWTSLFFGGLPALIRGDIASGLAIIICDAVISIPTRGFGVLVVGVIWAFVYNKRYTIGLIEKGYILEDYPEIMAAAKIELGIV